MALAQITYTDKEDRLTNSLADKYKVVAADMNEIKTVVNAVVAAFANLRQRLVYNVVAGDFSGGYVDIAAAATLTADTDIFVYTNEGSGTLLSEGTGPAAGYVFASGNGRFTMTPGNYRIVIFKPIS